MTTVEEFKELKSAIEATYKEHFIEGYKLAGGNVSKLALGLGLSRTTVHRYLKNNFSEDYRRKLIAIISENNYQQLLHQNINPLSSCI